MSTNWNNVVSYGAKPGSTDATATTAAINRAITNSNTTGKPLYFPAGTYNINARLQPLTRHGIRIIGDGRWNSIICPTHANGDVFTLTGQFQSIEDLAIQASTYRTNGFDVVVRGSNCILRNIFITFAHNGILINDASEVIIENVQFRYLTGSSGLLFTGTKNFGSYGLRIKNIVADNPYPIGVFNNNLKGSFVANKQYDQGDIFVSRGWVWQVLTSGVTGPSEPSVPTTHNWYTTNVSNGTTSIRAVSRINLTWIVMDNYANSMTILESALINGATGLRMQNSAGLTESRPNWIFAYDLEVDHAYAAGIDLQRGYGFFADTCWVGSTFIGNGIQADANFMGEIAINNSRIAASGQHGILMNGCPDWKIQNCFVFDNGINSSTPNMPHYYTPGVFSDITVAGGSIGFTITGCSLGYQTATGVVPTWTGQGIFVGPNCDRFIISGNMSRGNRNQGIAIATPTDNRKIVSGNCW
jgi:hypothetical protein